jgi:hypothetical protein
MKHVCKSLETVGVSHDVIKSHRPSKQGLIGDILEKSGYTGSRVFPTLYFSSDLGISYFSQELVLHFSSNSCGVLGRCLVAGLKRRHRRWRLVNCAIPYIQKGLR